ncbi:MBL fold metallo-hydrolase [Natrarchaeobius sp. A-rgal3]|uniref:MBL fold metallo-hydrolase n=1 Tax=Natrarchaeobius versutus TaxID=1679078 RepID=UPI00350F6278
MRVSFQHANPRQGNESTVLRFVDGETRACLLVDSGEGVDLDRLLGDEEYLTAVLLTHAHIDHYRTLGKNVRHSASVYASPATAAVIEQSLPEARKDNDLGDVDSVLRAVEPIDGWTSVLDGLEVRPIPAGHTPGAAGFLLRFRDETAAADTPLSTTTQTILVTGDFTMGPSAGFPPMPDSFPFDVDAVFLNAPRSDGDVTETRTAAIRTVLERAYGGSRVVLAASALTGVRYAVLLARAGQALERPVPISLVGQTARVYDALELDEPGVDTRPVFDRPSTVLEHGRVTIAGPDEPTAGSAKRLLRTIHDEPGDVFVQLSSGAATAVTNATCTTHYVETTDHPSLDEIDEFVRSLAPTEVIVKHANRYVSRQFQRRYDRCFTWGVSDDDEHVLYADGDWIAPPWIGESAERQIRRKQWRARGDQPIAAESDALALERESVDLGAEGVDLAVIGSRLSSSISNPYGGESTDDGSTLEFESDVTGPSPAVGVEDDSDTAGDADTRATTDVDRADGPSRERDEATAAETDSTDRTVRARVLGDGEGETILRVLESTDLEPGTELDVTISETNDSSAGNGHDDR